MVPRLKTSNFIEELLVWQFGLPLNLFLKSYKFSNQTTNFGMEFEFLVHLKNLIVIEQHVDIHQ